MRPARWAALLCLVVLIVATSSCAFRLTPAPKLTSVTVQLPWTHQAQFAGLYAADQKGYYAAEGLAVTFSEGGAQMNIVAPVLDGGAQFGIVDAGSLILARADGHPVRAIAAVFRLDPTVIVTLASSGITRPQDLVGKNIATSPARAPLLNEVMAHHGFSPKEYTSVISTPDLSDLYTGKVDARVMSLINEVPIAQAAGYKLNIMYPDNDGINFYADTIFAADDTIAKNPDLVRRFLRASLKGWAYAVANPATMAAMVLKYKPDADAALETAKMTASIPLVNTGEDHIGWMTPKMWGGMEVSLREQGLLIKTLDVTQVYTMQFVQEIYK